MKTERQDQPVSRRKALTTAGLGIAAIAALSRPAKAGEWNATEKANVEVVTGFCTAWNNRDANKIMAFFADNCAYRLSETQEPIKGREAIAARISGLVTRVDKFEVLDTFAKGPMVFNERIDSFNSGGLGSWHGVGVFFLKDGKIVEWQDYTIAMVRR